MKNLNNWFQKGFTKNEYIRAMDVHQEHLLTVYNGFVFSDEIKKELQSFQEKGLKAVILTADWCGDAMVNLPIFMRIADEALIEARYLIRDENLELMDQYLTNGTARSIPIIIFLNRDGEEIAKWGPRAPEVQEKVDVLKQNLPDKDNPDYQTAFKQFAQEMVQLFTTDKGIWQSVQGHLFATLKAIK